jgi:endonuclease YncB( thermonuclease family)
VNGEPPEQQPVVGLVLACGALTALFNLLASIQAPPPLPPPPPPPPAVVVEVPPPPPPKPAEPPPVTEATLAPLPETQLQRRPVHAIPEDAPGPNDRHVSEEVANGPHELAPRTPQKQISGVARPTGPVSLLVGDVRVQLFGIKAARPTDRCGFAAAADCVGAAERALIMRLPENAKIYCQVPLPKPGAAAAICLDPNGGDLGGYLVAEGLALADTDQSYDYVGAESIARNARRGLWGSR